MFANRTREEYLVEKLRRTKVRKATRRLKRTDKKERYAKLKGFCPCCGRSESRYDYD